MPILERAKHAYIVWSEYHATIPKTRRYTLGVKIDGLFIDIIEAMAAGSFLSMGDKEPCLRAAIRKLDTLKILLLVAWESNAIDTKKYAVLSEAVGEVGKQLGGWYGQTVRQNTNPPKGGHVK